MPAVIPAASLVPREGWADRLRLGLRRDWLFLALLAVAVAVRVLATVTFRPGLELYGDSYSYLQNAHHLSQDTFHPMGYAVFLRALWWLHATVAVVVVQHVLGLLAGAATYLAVRRLSTRPWLAAVAAAPVLLDGYEVDVEQFLLSDTWFLVLVLAACLVVLVPERPGTLAYAASGLLLAASTLTRGLGLAVLVPLAAYALARRVGVRRLVVLGACAVLPVLGYIVRFHQSHGSYALERVDGLWLYGRTAYFASCRPLPPEVRRICPQVPVTRREPPETYTWSKSRSPLYQRYHSPAVRDRKGKQFGIAVIKAEPVGYLRTTVVDGLLRDFALIRRNSRWAWNVHAWQMGAALTPRSTNVMYASPTLVASQFADRPFPDRVAARGPGGLLGAYQAVVYAWGPTLVLAMVLAGWAVLRRASRRDRRAWVAAALAASGFLLLLVPALTAVQDYRYVLPPQALLWPAGALAVEALLASRSAARGSVAAAAVPPPASAAVGPPGQRKTPVWPSE